MYIYGNNLWHNVNATKKIKNKKWKIINKRRKGNFKEIFV